MKQKLILFTITFFTLQHLFAQPFGIPIPTVNPNLGTGGNIGKFSSLQIVNGNPAVCYYDGTRANLVYVRAIDASGTVWGTPLTLDITGDVGQYCSLQIVNGNPAVSYYDATNGDLKFVRATDASGTAWSAPVKIDITDNVG